jgi:hypothetical protein
MRPSFSFFEARAERCERKLPNTPPAEVVVVFFNKCDEMTITNSIKLASQIDFGEHKKNFSK